MIVSPLIQRRTNVTNVENERRQEEPQQTSDRPPTQQQQEQEHANLKIEQGAKEVEEEFSTLAKPKVVEPTQTVVERWRSILYDPKNVGFVWKMRQFMDQVFSGISQMLFFDNPLVGAGIIMSLAVLAPSSAIVVFTGAFHGTLWAHVTNCDQALIRSGLFGFNSVLVSCALYSFVTAPATTMLILSHIGSLGSVLLFQAGCRMFTLPVVSIPFVIMINALVLLSPLLPAAAVTAFTPPPAIAPGSLPVGPLLPFIGTMLKTVPLTFSQLFFINVNNVAAGSSILAVAAAGAPRILFSGALGALVGNLVGFALGFDVMNGFWGFNSALTAMALYPTFGLPLWAAVGAAALVSAFQPIALWMFGSFGLPAVSFSFCLWTIAFLRFWPKKL